MRGYDCFDEPGPTFIRVYAHDASVPQTLADWDGTFGADRSLVRGKGWYVIGPPQGLKAVVGPPGRAPVTEAIDDAPRLTPRQDYLTTCTRFGLTEAERHLRSPRKKSANTKYYGELFPEVERDIHKAMDALDIPAIRGLAKESQPAALSPVGSDIKRSCASAYRQVSSAVEGV